MHKRFDRMNRQAKVRTGVRFTEEMKGHVSFGERDYESGAREGQETGTRLMFHLTIEVEDLNRFAADVRREAIASGWVRCEALGGRLPVERGLFNLLIDETGSARKRMLYRLFFRDGVGHPLTLTGTKVVGAGSGLRPWRDTTTLYSRVVRGHVGEGDDATAEIVASGILRLRPSGLLRQLATFRADGDPTKAYIAAVGRFDALFLVPGSGRSTAGATSQPETLLQTPRRACVGSSDGGGRGEANWRQHGGVRHEDAAGRHAGGLRLRHPHRRRPGVGLLRMARGPDGPVRAARDLRRSRGSGAGRGFLRLPEGRRRARRGKQDLRDDLALRVQQVVFRAWQPGRGADRRVVYLPGSHDAEVWSNEEIRTTLRERGLVDEFVLSYAARFELVSDRLVYCEHGNQFDPANIITDYDDPLDTPFGDHLVTDVVRRISPVGRIGRDLDMRDIGMVYPLVTIPERVAGRVFYDLLGRVATYLLQPLLVGYALQPLLVGYALQPLLVGYALYRIVAYVIDISPAGSQRISFWEGYATFPGVQALFGEVAWDALLLVTLLILFFFAVRRAANRAIGSVTSRLPGEEDDTPQTGSSAARIEALLESEDHPPQRRDLLGRDISVFVSGHTPAPALSTIPREAGETAVVVNSGCWLRQLRPIPARFGGPPVYVSEFVQTHARVRLEGAEIRAELWKYPRPAPRRLRTAERLAVLGRLPARPAADGRGREAPGSHARYAVRGSVNLLA